MVQFMEAANSAIATILYHAKNRVIKENYALHQNFCEAKNFKMLKSQRIFEKGRRRFTLST